MTGLPKLREKAGMEDMECHICALVCKGNIGETVGTLETRVKEHRNASQKGALEKSALAEHAWMNHHSIKW